MVHADLERPRECATLARECATFDSSAPHKKNKCPEDRVSTPNADNSADAIFRAFIFHVAHSRAKVAHSRGRSKSAWTILSLTLYFANTIEALEVGTSK